MNKDYNFKVGIIGLGYVGFSLFKLIKKNKLTAFGYDNSESKIESIKNKYLNFKNIISTNPKILLNCNIFLVCVPTPISKKSIPDLVYLKNACKTLSKFLKKNDIVIFESTVYPGITKNYCLPFLIGKSREKNFFIGYSPERYSPGEKIKLENITKIVSGENLNVAKKINNFYLKFIKKTHVVKTIEEAELVKNFENCQRDHNIALMNELKVLCDRTNININNVLKACKTKWNFNYYTPGLVGGHCISVDPYYLIDYSKQNNFIFSSIINSRKINNNFIRYNKSKILKFFKKHFLKKTDKILMIGATYKKNVDDLRNSGAWIIYKELKKKFINLDIYDPLVNLDKINNFNQFKAFVVLVMHSKINKNIKLMKLLNRNEKVYRILN